ncbi:unnamed protein product [Euphydryas editha]|uniref:C2H2-type domain-containing protein n=1 Tax=Euphydryas editha TaxID=104508 RepID=A0AAU9UGP2_EUPED|nr:unnamed protein product [Euphydryas editha]
MERKFNENGIMTGIADSFCLTCKKYLKFNQVSEHIIEPVHQKTFQSTDYVKKYKEDRIRKVELGYYCEMCNVMIQTLARIGIHVYENSHVNNKNIQQLRVSDAGVIAFDDILIENIAWNGMADGSCLLCNVDYSNEDDHKNDTTHILKLIQSKFELLKNKFVYRKIDDDSINCLICNTIVMEKSKETHINESEHKENYLKSQMIKKSKIETGICHNDNTNINLNENVTSNDITNNNLNENDTSKDATTKLKETNDNSVKTEVLTCDTSASETEIDVFNKNGVEEIGNKDEDELLTPAVAIKRAMKFAKDNNLNYKRNGTYCKLCDVRISSSLKMMKEHVAESSHKERAANKTTRKITKVPLSDFVKTLITLENIFIHDIVINDKICIENVSFCMLSKNEGVIRCQACEVTINLGNISEHVNGIKHNKAWQMISVITDFDSEFVREVRPRLYHCGYCNFIEAGLDSLKNHLKSINHLIKKRNANIRLQNHLPDIMNHRTKREFINFMTMFNSPF